MRAHRGTPSDPRLIRACAGIARARHAPFTGNLLYYMDPHYTRPALNAEDVRTDALAEEVRTGPTAQRQRVHRVGIALTTSNGL